MTMMQLYVMIDPFTNEPRYVGKTHEGFERRMYGHKYKETHLPSSQWVHSVIRAGAEPIMLELETMDINEDTKTAERFWIQYFKFIGANLTNRQFNGIEHLKGRRTRGSLKK